MPILTNDQGNTNYNKRMKLCFLLFIYAKITKDCWHPGWQGCVEVNILVHYYGNEIITAFSGGPFCNTDFFYIEVIFSYVLEKICIAIFIIIL